MREQPGDAAPPFLVRTWISRHFPSGSIGYLSYYKPLKKHENEIYEAKLKRDQFSFDIPLSSFIVVMVSVFA
ncbi:hypothetical protein Arad_4602 [Rhizobium rhizogenes K84]|uniref:Uncharacterized protein n=1 Tax=Rhizobium rhizogenes (strain K84 / ATCC BAA-868) TaxID=311403 RepID=B9JDF0_RHIR8|nr:hypothetical protein Arad_4602 [Rhizobium rhizogenes K84]